jgi:hypothetical protein
MWLRGVSVTSDGEALLVHCCGFRYDTDLVTRRSFSWCSAEGAALDL